MDTIKTGELIAEKRKELGLTQAQLGEQLHVSDKTISKWETGKGFPDISIIEDLCEKLHISAYELLKGEKAKDEGDKEAFSQGIEIFRKRFEKKRFVTFAIGFLLSMILVVTAFIHLNAPIYFEGPEKVKVEELNDGRLVLLADKEVSGCDIEHVNYEGRNEIFISSYKTLLSCLDKNKTEKIYLLAQGEKTDAVWYYPNEGSDVLIYGKETVGGVETLSRLIYNYWILLAGLFTVISAVAYKILQKRYYSDKILKYAVLPGAGALLSMLMVLAGKYDRIYNAAYYFSGIVLLSVLLYLLALLLLQRIKQKRKTDI